MLKQVVVCDRCGGLIGKRVGSFESPWSVHLGTAVMDLCHECALRVLADVVEDMDGKELTKLVGSIRDASEGMKVAGKNWWEELPKGSPWED